MQDEKPILFQDEMVRAILRRIKKQTRRVVKLKNHDVEFVGFCDKGNAVFAESKGDCWSNSQEGRGIPIIVKCPFGKVGDALWVREAWGTRYSFPFPPSQLAKTTPIIYRASEPDAKVARWYPSIFIPRWASRIQLKIIDIRVERLNSISEQDAIDEGIEKAPLGAGKIWKAYFKGAMPNEGYKYAAESFECLWDSINKKKMPWKNNPWVWVVIFEMVTP